MRDRLNYYKLVALSFTSPYKYAAKISSFKSLKNGFLFATSNISLGLFLQIIIKIVREKNSALFFPAVSEAFLLVFLFWVGFLGLGLILHTGAKILKGGGGLKASLIALTYSTTPLIFIFLPVLGVLFFVYFGFILTLAYLKVHQYSKTSAVINFLVPVLGFVLVLNILGIFNWQNIVSSFLF